MARNRNNKSKNSDYMKKLINNNQTVTIASKHRILILFLITFLNPFLMNAQHNDYSPVADAFVRGGDYKNTNYGSDPDLVVKQSANLSYSRMSYLKFSLSDIDATKVDTALLRLYAHNISGDFDVTLMQCSDDWVENTITWNNAPESTNDIITFPVSQSIQDQYLEIDITSLLLTEISKSNTISFILQDKTNSVQQAIFYSREASENHPMLAIATTELSIPESPSELNGIALDEVTIELNWKDNSNNELGFIVERKTNESTFTEIASLEFNQTHFVDTQLADNTTYKYRVIALGIAENSYSNEITVNTPKIPEQAPIAPSQLESKALTTDRIELNWKDNSTDEDYFIIMVKNGVEEFEVLDTVPENTTSYICSGLTPATNYTFRIYASNAYFDSDLSNEISCSTMEHGNNFYIDSNQGDDNNEGNSPNNAWQSLDKINEYQFSPGDSIFLACGSTWIGQLSPKGSGANDLPIYLGSYNQGSKPLIDGNGIENRGALYLYNQSYWEIENIEITNNAPTAGLRRGVEITGEECGIIRHIHLKNLYIHHIKGTVGNDYEVAKQTGGIFFMIKDNSITPSRFNDVLVENCEISYCDNQGIVTQNDIRSYPGDESWHQRCFTNFVFRGNTIHHISKNAMILRMLEGGLIEYNVCYTTATGTTGNTIFTRSSRDVVLQYNEGYDNRSTGHDGSLYDADLESPGCIFQYSYSHDNAHGLYWQCTVQEDTDVIVRYNISQNDKGYIFYVNYPSNGTDIYNNTVFVGSHRSPIIIKEGTLMGGTRSYTFRNNLIINMSNNARYEWVGSQYITNRIIENNLFYGNHPESEPDDSHKITSDPCLNNPGTATTGIENLSGYTLLPNSPAIDAGINIDENGGYDYWGNETYVRKPDIGAHEFQGVPTLIENSYSDYEHCSFKIYPNPLITSTEISFQLEKPDRVLIQIFDINGKMVKTIVNKNLLSGQHSFVWDGTDSTNQKLNNGIYICNLLRSNTQNKPMSRAIFIK